MPFTVAHAAAALPLKRLAPRWLSLSGLIAGAMAPDLLYFLFMTTVDRGLSHSWSGMVVFCVPAGVAFALAFHWLVKYPLLTNLPSPWDRRFSGLAVSRFGPRTLRGWVVLVLSVALGTLTHFAWDSFTHGGGVVAKAVPFLQEWVHIFGFWYPVTGIAQHISTLVGLAVLFVSFSRGWLLPPPVELPEKRGAGEKLRFWAVSGLFAAGFAATVTWVYQTYMPDRVATTFTTFGLAGWAGFFWGVAGWSVVKQVRPDPHKGRSGREMISRAADGTDPI